MARRAPSGSSRLVSRLGLLWAAAGVVAALGATITVGAASVGGTTVDADRPLAENVLSEDWELGPGAWSSDVLWEVGAPTGGPDSAHGGTNCAGTDLDGDYPEVSAGRIWRSVELPDIDREAGERLMLRFYQWVATYNAGDYGEIQIDYGTGWINLSDRRTNNGDRGVWSPSAVDLSDWAGTPIQLSFYFKSVNTANPDPDSDRGWYIDDIRLVKEVIAPFSVPEGFEQGDGDWWADNGLWETGVPTAGPSGGPSGAYAGERCACTVLSGDYPVVSSSRLISPPVLLPAEGSAGPLRLRWAGWLNTFNTADSARVLISVDEGPWTRIAGPFSGSSGTWSVGSAPLSAYAGNSVRFAFGFVSFNSSANNPDEAFGWCIDQVYVEGATPVVVGTDPAPGAVGVSTDAEIRVSFGGLMDPATLTGAQVVVAGRRQGLISGSFEIPSEVRGFTFRPDAPFACEDTITVLLTDDIRDAAGRALDGDGDWSPGGDASFSFVTGTCPFEAVELHPAPDASDVSPLDSIRVRFSRPVDPATIDAASWTVAGRDGGWVDGTYSVAADSMSAVFRPLHGTDRYFVFGDSVTSCLTPAIRSGSGEDLVTPSCWSFVVSDSSILAIAGRVRYRAAEGAFVPDVTLALDPGGRDTTGADGYYAFLELDEVAYEVTPEKAGDLRTALSAYDASLAARTAVGTVHLDSLATLAADVSGNGTVTAYDAAIIARRVAGLVSSWPAGSDWTFAPGSRSYSPLGAGRVHEDFRAVLRGDVSASWDTTGLVVFDLAGGEPPRGMLWEDNDLQARIGASTLRNGLPVPAWSVDLLVTGGSAALAADAAAAGWSLVAGPEGRIVAYGARPVAPGGTLIELRPSGDAHGGALRVEALRIDESEFAEFDGHTGPSAPTVEKRLMLYPSPNPVSGSKAGIEVRFALAAEGDVVVRLFSIQGAEVLRRDLGRMPAGEHAWDLPTDALPNGVYFYEVSSGAERAARKLVLAR